MDIGTPENGGNVETILKAEYTRFEKFKKRLKSLSPTAIISLTFMALMLVSLPLAILLALSPKTPGLSQAVRPITPPGQQANFGRAISLDGVSSYLNISDDEDFDLDLGYTVEAWIKPNSPVYGHRIVNRSTGNQISFSIVARSAIEGELYILDYDFSVANQGNTNCKSNNINQHIQYPLSEVNKITSWHHIAGVVHDDGKMDIFVDGKRSESNFNTIAGVCERNIDVQIGARKFDNGEADGIFYGLMDEVRISKVSRYENNFDLPIEPFVPDSDTISLYNFNGDFKDSSGLGHDAAEVGKVKFVKSTLPL